MHQQKMLGHMEDLESLWWDCVPQIRSLMDDVNVADQRIAGHQGIAAKKYSTTYDDCLEKPQPKSDAKTDDPSNEEAAPVI